MIHENALRSKKLNAVSLGAGEMWFRLLLLVDDNGNYFGDRLVIYANAMRNKKGVDDKAASNFVDELIEIGLLEEYQVPDEEGPYVHVVNFHEFQAFRNDRPVKVVHPIHPNGPYFAETGVVALTERNGNHLETNGIQAVSALVQTDSPILEVIFKDKVEVEGEADAATTGFREGNFNKFRECWKEASGRFTKPKPYTQNVERYQELCRRFGEDSVLDAVNSYVELHGKSEVAANKWGERNFLFDECEDLVAAKKNGTLHKADEEGRLPRLVSPD